MQPKRLLMISTDRLIFREGSAVRARQAVYAKEWDEVHIIVFAGKEYSETNISPNCWVYSTRSSAKFLYPFDAIKLGRFIIEKRKITEITCQDSSLTAMAGVSLKKQFNIPLEIQIHEDIGSPYYAKRFSNRVRKILALSYIPKADALRVVSNGIKKYLVESLKIADSKINVRPIAVNTDWIKKSPITADLHKKYPQFKKIILMASRLEPEKNIELAINSWSEVIKLIPSAGLIIVGSGSQENGLKRLASRLGLDQSVLFESWADQSTLASYYKTADLFLVTSLYEGYGMTLVEAQAAGIKTVSTDVGVAREAGAKIIGWDMKEAVDVLIYNL